MKKVNYLVTFAVNQKASVFYYYQCKSNTIKIFSYRKYFFDGKCFLKNPARKKPMIEKSNIHAGRMDGW